MVTLRVQAFLHILIASFLLLSSNYVQASTDITHSLSTRAATATTNVTQLLTTVLNTYVWQIYKYQAQSCVETPYIGTDCGQIIPCYGVPSISNINIVPNTYGYSGEYLYLYSTYDVYGFTYSNFTKFKSNFTSTAAQLAYAYCQVNSTCAAALQSGGTNLTSALLSYVNANFAKIQAMLPKNNTMAWQPSPGQAAGLSVFTALPDMNAELYGTHDIMVYAAANNTFNLTTYEQLRQIGNIVKGGASAYESLLNTLVVGSLSCDYNTGYQDMRRDIQDDGGEDVVGAQTEKQKFQDKVAKLRFNDRNIISTVGMDYFRSFGMHHNSIYFGANATIAPQASQTCANGDHAQSVLDGLNKAQDACNAEAILPSLLSLGTSASNMLNKPFAQLPGNTAKTMWNANGALIAATSALCSIKSAFNMNPCYPGATAFSDPTTLVGGAFSVVGLYQTIVGAAKLTRFGTIQLAIDGACGYLSLARNTYQSVVNCCNSNCNSVVCQAGAISCAFFNSPC